jgi:hypothetical protein
MPENPPLTFKELAEGVCFILSPIDGDSRLIYWLFKKKISKRGNCVRKFKGVVSTMPDDMPVIQVGV